MLTVKLPSHPGGARYMIDEDGYVASELVQQQARDHLHALWRTLNSFGLLPYTWMSADVRALEFIRLSMRHCFVHFQLCDSYWKVDYFASHHYPQWTGRPKDSKSTIKKENVKPEPVERTSESILAPKSMTKRPQSLTIAPSSRIIKKKKKDIRTQELPDAMPIKKQHPVCVSPSHFNDSADESTLDFYPTSISNYPESCATMCPSSTAKKTIKANLPFALVYNFSHTLNRLSIHSKTFLEAMIILSRIRAVCLLLRLPQCQDLELIRQETSQPLTPSRRHQDRLSWTS